MWFWILPGSQPIAGQTASSDVSITGSLSARFTHQNEALQFTLTVKNKADAKTSPNASLRDLTLQGLPAGYSIDAAMPVCILPLVPPQIQSCDVGANFEKYHRVFIPVLSPGQSVTVQGYLKPNSDAAHKSAALTVVVAWIAAQSGIPSSQSASLGENQVLGTWQSIATWISDLFKLLAIPAILALIAWWLNNQDRRRDNAFAEASRIRDEAFANANRAHDEQFANANRARDEAFAIAQLNRQKAQHEHEQEQALRSETWKQMLPISHNYAAKFYLPLSLAAQYLAAELDRPIKKRYLAFYYLLLCGKKMTATRNEIGGFYFKDLRGERLAASCWEIQREACLGKPDDAFYKGVHAAIDSFDDGIDSFESFESNFLDTSTDPPTFVDHSIEETWKLFNTWCKDKGKVEKTAQYLRGFYAVLDYESNRPYQYWYDSEESPAHLVIKEETEKLLKKLLEEAKYSPQQVQNYFKDCVRPD
ncbi:MAG: hypothetical protein WAM65_12395 [Candidatus Korobacteraceae bacterium]